MGNDWKVSKAQSPKEALDIRQPSPICPTQNLKQVLDFATAKHHGFESLQMYWLNKNASGYP